MGKPRYDSSSTTRYDSSSSTFSDVTPSRPNIFATAVLLGDMKVGKSSILTILAGNKKASANSKPVWRHCPMTLTISVCRQNRVLQMKVRDTGGQEKFRSLTASYYRGAHGCLVLFDVTKENTFNNVTYWLHDLKEYSSNPEISAILVGTKCHVSPEERAVSYESAQKYAESVGLKYMEVSAEEGTNVTEVFETLADLIIDSLTKDHSVITQHPNKVILQRDAAKPKKKQWCSC